MCVPLRLGERLQLEMFRLRVAGVDLPVLTVEGLSVNLLVLFTCNV